ncbi:MAG: ATP-binding protein [Chloroflexota bacterium]
MINPLQRFLRRYLPALRVALMYLLIGGGWIIFSDRILETLVPNAAELSRWQSVKGIGFVLAMAILLFLERAHDIRLKQREKELLSQRVALFDQAPNPIWVADLPDLRFLAVNPAAEQFYGYNQDEFLAMRVSDLRTAEEKATVASMVESLTRDGYFRYTTRHICKDGRVADVSVTARTMLWKERPAAVFSMVDITELLQKETALRELAQQLEQKVAERTADLQRKNRELETFAYSVSHDLKAPLRGIDGYSRLLLEDHAGDLNEEGRQFLHAIRRGAEQMARLIDALLAYSRLERRNLSINQLEIRPLLDTLLREFQSEIEQSNAQITIDLPFKYIYHDYQSLYQALHNLLENALKFSRGRNPPRIEIGGEEREESHVLWVRDNGIGFDMQYHERIFGIFQRLNHGEDFPGTGVGLAIVRKAMERIGGWAWAVSAPGEGATFYIEVPKPPPDL